MRLDKYFRSMLIGTAFLAAVTVAGCGQQAAQPDPQAPTVVYDEDHRDNHNWDAREAAAYQRWEAERARPHQDFTRRPPDEQKDYWNWRHSHPD